MDPQFDIDHYLVNLQSDLMTVTRRSKNTSLDMEMPVGEIFANVATVTYCGSESQSSSSNRVIGNSGGLFKHVARVGSPHKKLWLFKLKHQILVV